MDIGSNEQDSALSPYRILDLSDGRGHLCGRILADLGADVLKVEPPWGDSARQREPFYKDTPHPEKSLFFWAYNLNKRSITLRLESADGRELFKQLVTTADAIIESFAPGYMAGLGLGYANLEHIKPDLVVTSITPFGQSGPYANYLAPDLVGQAMGGLMYVTGDSDRPPVRITFPQAYLHAGAEAAVGTLMALYNKGVTGQEQHVDVSMQQSVVWSLMNATPTWDLNQVNIKREGALRSGGTRDVRRRINWPCKDGFVTFGMGARPMKALVKWMDSEGVAPDYLTLMDFEDVHFRELPQEEIDLISEPVGQFFLNHTKEELFQGALENRIILFPVSTMKDLAENEQLATREYYIEVYHPELEETVIYPGPFVKLSETPWRLTRRPPLIGEHNQEIYCGELGLSKTKLASLKQIGAV